MSQHDFEHMRRAMVASQLRTTGVSNPRVVAAMGAVPRERFVPERYQAIAYIDRAIPLGNGRELTPPMALGRLLSEANLDGSERALVIGAATGYSAAVLARLVASVVALEEDGELAATAKRTLNGADVKVVKGPLIKGCSKEAPYDFILIDGAVEYMPDAVVGQLADGGALAAALLDDGVTRLSIGRSVSGSFGMTTFSDAAAPILPGFVRPRGFSF